MNHTPTPITDETEIKKVIVTNQRAYEVPADVAGAYEDLVREMKWALPYLEKLNEEKKTLGFGMGLSGFKEALAKAEVKP